MTSEPIKLYTNFTTLILILTFTELREVQMEHFRQVLSASSAGNDHSSEHLVSSLSLNLSNTNRISWA